MSNFEQTALIISEMERRHGEVGFISVFEHLVEYYRLSPDLNKRVARLEFGPSNEWVRTQSVDDGDRSLAELIAQHQWLRLSGKIPLDRKLHCFELYFYPSSNTGERAGLLLTLEPSAYLAVFGGRPSYHGLFNDDARSALIALCLGVTGACRGDGFLYDFDPGELVPLTTESLTRRLLHPVLEPPGEGPGLVCGISRKLVTRQALDSVWKPENINETTTGYAFLALMRPEEQPTGRQT